MRKGVLIAALLWLSAAARADDRLINVDGASTAPKGSLAASIDVRTLGGPEDNTYTSLAMRLGLTSHIEIGARGVTGSKRSRPAANGANILYGGRDAEVYGKYRFADRGPLALAAMAGVSFPDTPAQSSAVPVLGGTAEYRVNDRMTGYVNPRAVLLDGNPIVGIGIGGRVRLTEALHLVGDWTGIITGDNTRSMADGSRRHGDVWGVAVRWGSHNANGQFELDLGWGNATGSTTGFSLTPGLGSSNGFYFALRARR